ncbi:MAG: tetratricopeptide repeat protein [Chthoniobacterales bacterium]
MKTDKSPLGERLGPAHYIFALVLFVRIIVLTRLTASASLLPMRGDMHFYDDWAQRILHGQLTDHLAFYGLPLYAFLLALIYKLIGYGPFVPGLLQAFADAATAVIIYHLGVRIFSSPSASMDSADSPRLTRHAQFIGGAAALGWAFFLPAQTYAVILMPTVWLVLASWFLVWRIIRTKTAPKPVEAVAYGALTGFVAMGVASILFLLPLIGVAIVLRPSVDRVRPFAAKAIALVLIVVGLLAGTAPCWIHNYFIARDPVFLSAHGGVNFWVGNNPLATGYPRFPPGLHAGQEAMLKDSINVAEKTAGRALKRSYVSEFWSGKARDYIRHHFGAWLRLLGTKVKNFWNAFQYDDLSMITALREHRVVFPALRFGVIAALAIPGLLIAWRRFPLSRWVTVAVLLEMLALLPVFITERYRLAAVPGLLLFAAFGLSIFWEACATNQLRLAAAYIALLVGSTIFVSWPVRDPSLWALDIYNSGWQAFESGDLAVAEQKLQLAYSYVPENAETNFALGNLRLAQGRPAEAKSYYFATLRLDPTHEGGYNNLGVLALQEKRWGLAARFFENALKQDPRDAKSYYLLAEAHFRDGDLSHARGEIAEALKLSPSQPEFTELWRQIEEESE